MGIVKWTIIHLYISNAQNKCWVSIVLSTFQGKILDIGEEDINFDFFKKDWIRQSNILRTLWHYMHSWKHRRLPPYKTLFQKFKDLNFKMIHSSSIRIFFLKWGYKCNIETLNSTHFQQHGFYVRRANSRIQQVW